MSCRSRLQSGLRPGACARCDREQPPGAAACRHCLSPLNETGVWADPNRPFDWRPVWRAVGALGTAALAGWLLWPGSPARAALSGWLAPAPALRQVTLPVPQGQGLGLYEPSHGCFLGAYVLQDVNISGSMARWEELTGKGHASYLRYVGYGKRFPSEWVASVRRLGAVPNLALEPNAGLGQVQDDLDPIEYRADADAEARAYRAGKLPADRYHPTGYLRRFARDAAQSGGPVFLRFASEMNGPWTAYHGDPARYRASFRMVSKLMREEAPNVAMVWTPYCTPLRPIPDYYPGDDAVDWVGVNIYSVHHHDGLLHRPAHHEDPADLLTPIYALYADRKPIQISEYAATHSCKACRRYTADFAMDKMIRMYRSLPLRFPRVRMIHWFSYDTLSSQAAENNYSVIDDPVIRDTYRRLIASDYFLPRIRRGSYWEEHSAPLFALPAAAGRASGG